MIGCDGAVTGFAWGYASKGDGRRHRDSQRIGKLVEGTDRGGGFTALDHAQGVGGEPAGFCKGAHGEVVCLTQTTDGFPPR